MVFLNMMKFDPELCLVFLHLDFLAIICDNIDNFPEDHGELYIYCMINILF